MKKGKVFAFLLSLLMVVSFLTACDYFPRVEYSVVNEVGGTLKGVYFLGNSGGGCGSRRSDSGEFDSGETNWFKDEKLEFTAFPEEGWQVKEWKLNGDILKDDNNLTYKDLTYTIIMTKGKVVIITVEFEEIKDK